jgi:hypothetical protein
MRKEWIIIVTIISFSFLSVHNCCGNDKYKKFSSSFFNYDGQMAIYLFGDWKEPVVEMVLIDSKGRKTGNDFKQNYNEIPKCYYLLKHGDDSDDIYYRLGLDVVDGEIYKLRIISQQNTLYTLLIYMSRNKGDRAVIDQKFDNVKIKKGEIHNYTLKFSLTAPMEIKRIN